MLLCHQFFQIILLVMTVPYLLKAKMDAGPAGWLAAVLANWQHPHKKSHPIQFPIFSCHSPKGKKGFHCNSSRKLIIFIYIPFFQCFCARHWDQKWVRKVNRSSQPRRGDQSGNEWLWDLINYTGSNRLRDLTQRWSMPNWFGRARKFCWTGDIWAGFWSL